MRPVKFHSHLISLNSLSGETETVFRWCSRYVSRAWPKTFFPAVVLRVFAELNSELALVLPTLQIESYWTYEVCHGKHIRQYHEEKETGQVSDLQVMFR